MPLIEISANVESKKKIKNSKKFKFWIRRAGSKIKIRSVLSPSTKHLMLLTPLLKEKMDPKEVASAFKKYTRIVLMQSKKKDCWPTSFKTIGKFFFRQVTFAALESNKKIMQVVRKISLKKKGKPIIAKLLRVLVLHAGRLGSKFFYNTNRQLTAFVFQTNNQKAGGAFFVYGQNKLKTFKFISFRCETLPSKTIKNSESLSIYWIGFKPRTLKIAVQEHPFFEQAFMLGGPFKFCKYA